MASVCMVDSKREEKSAEEKEREESLQQIDLQQIDSIWFNWLERGCTLNAHKFTLIDASHSIQFK